MPDFIQQCVSCEAEPDGIDDVIDRWHDQPGGKPLHEFLGMTEREYALWAADSSVLPAIVRIRANNKCLDDLLEEFRQQMPAEALTSSKALSDWLHTQQPWEQPDPK